MPSVVQSGSANALKDRKATIAVIPVLQWNSLNPLNITTSSIEFIVTSCEPDNTITVDPNTGAIDISAMASDKQYSENIDITLVLNSAHMTDPNGNLLTGDQTPRWAKKDEGPTYIDAKGGGSGVLKHLGYGWFCNIISLGPPLEYHASPPVEIDKMKFKRKSDTELEIADNTDDGSPPYAYMMAFVLPNQSSGDYYISIDPALSRKGLGGSN